MWTRGLGGLPFSQSTGEHWEGMTPLRGKPQNLGGLPSVTVHQFHDFSKCSKTAGGPTPPADLDAWPRGACPSFMEK